MDFRRPRRSPEAGDGRPSDTHPPDLHQGPGGSDRRDPVRLAGVVVESGELRPLPDESGEWHGHKKQDVEKSGDETADHGLARGLVVLPNIPVGSIEQVLILVELVLE